MIRTFLLVYLVTIILILILVRTTNADFLDSRRFSNNFLKVATFDFSDKSTANEGNLTQFFNVSAVKAGGFDVKTLRIKNEGSVNKSKLKVSYFYRLGSEVFCNDLNLKILKEWAIIYEGKLSALTLNLELNGKQNEDFIFILSFPENMVNNSACSFDFILEENSVNELFSDTEKLENFVSNF